MKRALEGIKAIHSSESSSMSSLSSAEVFVNFNGVNFCTGFNVVVETVVGISPTFD
jgi:hypothetical protein